MTEKTTTQIKTVTVFRDGARIVRKGTAKVKAGEQTIIAGGITHYAQEDSFRVKGKGHAVLRGIDVKRTTKTYEPEEELKKLLKDLKALEKQQEVLTSKAEIQEGRISHLNTIASNFASVFGKWFAAGESSLGQLDEMDKTTMKQITDAKKKLRTIQDEEEELSNKISVLQANINKVQGQRKTETHFEVHILIDAKEATELDLEVTYQLSYAGWSPTYDVDLRENEASLKRIAMIYNNSLEDWQDVALSVSTASARPVRAVEASPFYVDIYRPLPVTTASTGMGVMRMDDERDREKAGAMDLDDLMDFKESEEEVAEPMPEIIESYAQVSESLSGVVIYEVPGEISIKSDDDPHPVTLTEENFSSRKLHFWNAYAMPEVVAQDEITNGDSVLLPGPIKVYALGDFIGESNIGSISPREKFRLGTRTSYDVKATKKLISKDTDKAGITRGKTKREYQYQLELESFAKSEIEVMVVDRIPYSTSEKIVIELLSPVPIPKKSELGVLEWEVKVAPQKKTTLTYNFEAEWEKDIRIQPPLP
ncbi:MAG: mucoidy inhibitor MuiA family protein [Candidatus Thorarchaeota archaeon]